MRRIRVQQGDIVVVVPRWIIAAVGLLMLLVGLSGSFLIIFAGAVTEGILLSLFAFFFVPFQLLLMYILWRFYWYLLVLGVLLAPLLSCASVLGIVRIAGITYANVGGSAPIGAFMGTSTNYALAVVVAIGLAAVVVLIVALVLKAVIGSPFPVRYDDDIDEAPQRRKRTGQRDLWKDERLPHPHDPYWDDK